MVIKEFMHQVILSQYGSVNMGKNTLIPCRRLIANAVVQFNKGIRSYHQLTTQLISFITYQTWQAGNIRKKNYEGFDDFQRREMLANAIPSEVMKKLIEID